MTSAGFIVTITICIAGIFAAIFSFIAAYDKAYRSARWFAFAYGCGVITTSLEFALINLPPALHMLINITIFTSGLLAFALGVVGACVHFGLKIPAKTIIGLVVVSVVANCLVYDMARDNALRLFAYQIPYFAAQLLGAVMLSRAGNWKKLEKLDRITVVFLALSAFNFLAKPFIAWGTGGIGAEADAYLSTTYAEISQTLASVLVLVIGALFVLIYVRDMLRDIRIESETDRLSGLFNRRGFEERVKAFMAQPQPYMAKTFLVICDLDFFKQINDAYGHDTGDNAIRIFSQRVREHALSNAICGRIGGEEFAIFLPRASTATAKLFSESVRNAYARSDVEGIPEGERYTVSIGVAQQASGESYESLLRRADGALYQAKNTGRDKVVNADPIRNPQAVGHSGRRQYRDALNGDEQPRSGFLF